MARKVLFFTMILCAMGGFIHSQAAVSIDEAIKIGAKEIENKLAKGTKVVVLNFNSPSPRFSNYVLEELTSVIFNEGNLTVVDRQNLALIQQEMDFQLSGEVSDESAQEIGKKLGAQSIISGSMDDIGSSLRMRFRTIEVVSAAIQVLTSVNVKKDNQTVTLLQGAAVSTVATGPVAATAGFPHGLNFATSYKIAMGGANTVFGVGSFLMGDTVGGIIIGGVEAAGFLTGIIGLAAANSPAVGIVGYGIAGAGVLYGFIRPFQYDKALAKKNGTYVADNNPIDSLRIAIVPDNHGISMVHLSYSLHF